ETNSNLFPVFGFAKKKKAILRDALFLEDHGRRPPPVRGTLPLNSNIKTPPNPGSENISVCPGTFLNLAYNDKLVKSLIGHSVGVLIMR
ncbi:hypothetical protein P8845_04175, partial [Bacillus spizizenii]|nr:hypothetical protein [Bacillus spizizenii]